METLEKYVKYVQGKQWRNQNDANVPDVFGTPHVRYVQVTLRVQAVKGSTTTQ